MFDIQSINVNHAGDSDDNGDNTHIVPLLQRSEIYEDAIWYQENLEQFEQPRKENLYD